MFKKQLHTGSQPIWHKARHWNKIHFFFLRLGSPKTWNTTKANSMTLIFHCAYTWPSYKNKYTLYEPIILENTNILIYSQNVNFYSVSNMVVSYEWHITNTINCISYNSPHYPLSTGCNEKYTEASLNIKILVYKLICIWTWRIILTRWFFQYMQCVIHHKLPWYLDVCICGCCVYICWEQFGQWCKMILRFTFFTTCKPQ